MSNTEQSVAEASLELKAIKLQPADPFTWTTGYRMPIYNDNRTLLGSAAARKVVTDGFERLIRDRNLSFDVIAGVETAAIAWATSVADRLGAPLAYVRKKAKEHGAKKRVEGADIRGKRVLLIEDLISTGASSVDSLQALRDEGGEAEYCLSIFTYGFESARQAFSERSAQCLSLLTYQSLLPIAVQRGAISAEQRAILEEWSADPFGWGERHGFPRKLDKVV